MSKLLFLYETSVNEKYIYFPLHVPNDIALTLRSPEFVDQLSLVDYLCRITPLGYKLAIKEHPTTIGAFSYHKIRNVLKKMTT